MYNCFSKLLICFASLMILHRNCNADFASEIKKLTENVSNKLDIDPAVFDNMEKAIQQIESLSLIKQSYSNVGEAHPEVVRKVYNLMLAVIEEITKEIKHPDKLSQFIQANGITRVLSTNLMDSNTRLRTNLLLLLKVIFDKIPSTNEIPLNIVDRLMDIFENDGNLSLKAHSLDMLCKWLPNNPKIQLRVMKIKGLEPFYNQIELLEISSIRDLLELFNRIVTEHVDARSKKEKKMAEDDRDRLITYQRAGLLERLSTPRVCSGLLNIFEVLWTYNSNEIDNVKTVLEVVKSLKPFCLKIYKKIPKAVETFQSLLKYVKDDEKIAFLEVNHVNATDVAMLIGEYLNKGEKDEL